MRIYFLFFLKKISTNKDLWSLNHGLIRQGSKIIYVLHLGCGNNTSRHKRMPTGCVIGLLTLMRQIWYLFIDLYKALNIYIFYAEYFRKVFKIFFFTLKTKSPWNLFSIFSLFISFYPSILVARKSSSLLSATKQQSLTTTKSHQQMKGLFENFPLLKFLT